MTLLDREPDELRAAIAEAKTAGDLKALATLKAGLDAALRWKPQPYQEPPPEGWWTWVFSGGAGSGKTDTGAWWINQHMEGPPCDTRLPGGHKALIAGPTFGDAVTTCWSAPAGLSTHNEKVRLVGRKDGTRAIWPNGAEALFAGLHTKQDAELLRARAANCCTWWIDEAALAVHLKTAVDLIQMRARGGKRPHGVVTSTPKPTGGWKHLVNLPEVVVTRGSSFDNVYLSEIHKARLARFRGTRLEAQEIYGQLVDDFEGALWSRDHLDAARRLDYPVDELERVQAFAVVRLNVGVDPSTWDPELGDDPGTIGEGLETGIVVAGIDDQDPPHVYVFDDASLRGSGERWGRAVSDAYHRWGANSAVPEVNLGGLVLTTLRLVDPSVHLHREGNRVGVRAAQGKRARAEPVATLYEQGRAHHVGSFVELENQMCQWDPKESWSPDRLDALVWAITSLAPWQTADSGTGLDAMRLSVHR